MPDLFARMGMKEACEITHKSTLLAKTHTHKHTNLRKICIFLIAKHGNMAKQLMANVPVKISNEHWKE